MSKEDIDNLFDAINLPESDAEYRAIYTRGPDPTPMWFKFPKLSIWQRIYYFIIRLFELKHAQRVYKFPYAPSRTASYEVTTETRRVEFRKWEPNDSS